jgi:hypothetical protein
MSLSTLLHWPAVPWPRSTFRLRQRRIWPCTACPSTQPIPSLEHRKLMGPVEDARPLPNTRTDTRRSHKSNCFSNAVRSLNKQTKNATPAIRYVLKPVAGASTASAKTRRAYLRTSFNSNQSPCGRCFHSNKSSCGRISTTTNLVTD